MNLAFYLFDVDHGQSAVAKLPNGHWCIFDAGSSATVSPTDQIRRIATNGQGYAGLSGLLAVPQFNFLKATVSHLHADHLSDFDKVLNASPAFLRTVDFDEEYLRDVLSTSARDSCDAISGFCQRYNGGFGPATTKPDYGIASIRELSLPLVLTRIVGGSASSRVNNASVVTRIDCHGNSILICGDMEKEAWDFALTNPLTAAVWRPHVSNIDVLVAPHHGHASGYSTELLALAKPSVVLVSVQSRDPHVDPRYSCDSVRGVTIGSSHYRRITTREKGSILIEIEPPDRLFGKGRRVWTFGV